MNNHLTRSENTTEERVFSKAQAIAKSKNVIRHPNNLFCVQSGNVKTPQKFYVVAFDTVLDCFTCDCPDWEYRGATRPCCHILAACLVFGSGGGAA